MGSEADKSGTPVNVPTNSSMATNSSTRFVGKLEAFIIGESFEDYLTGVNNYLALNGIEKDEIKMRLFLNLVGGTASAKIIKAFLPAPYSEKTFDEVIAKAKKLFGAERNSIVEHYKFNNRSQKEGESLGDFAIELQAMSEHCEFGTFLDTALRDRFAAGIINKHTKMAVLNLDSKKSFADVVECAKKEDLIYKEAVQMTVKVDDKVNYVQKNFASNDKLKKSRITHNKNAQPSQWQGYQMRGSERGVRCYRCGKVGHIARSCFANIGTKDGRQKFQDGGNRSNAINEDFGYLNIEHPMEYEDDTLELSDEKLVANIRAAIGESKQNGSIEFIDLVVDSVRLKLECDTGSRVSLISLRDYRKHFMSKRIAKVNLPLSVISGQMLSVKGKIKVNICIRSKKHVLDLFVVDTMQDFIPLLGRDWLNVICPEWRNAFKVNAIVNEEISNQDRDKKVTKFRRDFARLFDNDLSTPIKDVTVNIRMNENAKPFVHKAYNVPFSIREDVGKEIDNLEKMGILERIEYSEWASPMVVAKKANGEIRPCLDGSKTINPHIETHHYPIPLIDELLANKGEAKWFCVLDLKGAYTQLKVDEETKKLLAVNTIKGLYAYNRLPFGVKPAASIFQFAMDKILMGLSNVQAFIDDVLVWGKSIEELHAIMEGVLERLLSFNVKVNFEKCQWFVDKVKYLGHIITREGIKPNREKLQAIIDAPIPKNVSELKSFLGMIMFYSKFMKNLCVKLRALYELLKKEKEWKWTDECQKSFELCKKELLGDHILTHYDPKKPIVITCDASDEGISGVLSHVIDGHERPVLFVSRTLTNAEKKYPILHREALAIVFAMEKFYKYVYGHFVKIFTDHKPLEGVFNGKKGAPPVVATRLQRYVIRLSIFEYEIKHRKGKNNGNADCLSRLPIKGEQSEADKLEERNYVIKAITTVKDLILNVEMIKRETDRDGQLVKLRQCITEGWKNEGSIKELKHYHDKNDLLSVEDGCVTLAGRIVIPNALRLATLKILHTNHLGETRMKQIARRYVYWQGINAEIERFLKECESCQVLRKDDRRKVYGKWPEVTFPWERMHIDFFHFKGKEFLIAIDAYSRWIEVKEMRGTNAEKVIEKLEEIFGVFGWGVEIVADNGPPFNSYKLRKYLNERNIKLTHSPPYHPQSNGLVERAVQTVKTVLRKLINDCNSSSQMTNLIEKFLKNYRNLPTTEENIVPAHRMFSYKPRCELTNLELKRNEELQNKISEENKLITFKKDEEVLYLSKLNGYTFATKAQIIEKKSKHVYLINCKNIVKLAHCNQLRKSALKNFIFKSTNELEEKQRVIPIEKSQSHISSQKTPVVLRRSSRERIPVRTFNLNWFLPHYK